VGRRRRRFEYHLHKGGIDKGKRGDESTERVVQVMKLEGLEQSLGEVDKDERLNYHFYTECAIC